jgi:hypothetical protein
MVRPFYPPVAVTLHTSTVCVCRLFVTFPEPSVSRMAAYFP